METNQEPQRDCLGAHIRTKKYTHAWTAHFLHTLSECDNFHISCMWGNKLNMRHTSSHVLNLILTTLNRATLASPDRLSAAQMEKKGLDYTTDINNPYGIGID